MADLEDGVFAGSSFDPPATNTSLSVDYVTAMLKGNAGSFALKGGSARTVQLSNPMKALESVAGRSINSAEIRCRVPE